MRVGVFGGSFDPIHRGHVDPVLEAIAALDLDRVLYLPTASPPHKDGPIATALARYTMAELALLPHSHLLVSPAELDRDPAFTVDTLEILAAERPDDALVLLIGADSLLALDTWRRWRRILELVEIGVLMRPDYPWFDRREHLPAEVRAAIAEHRIRPVTNRPVEVSSTRIRQALGQGVDPPAGSLAPPVLDYLRKYEPYG